VNMPMKPHLIYGLDTTTTIPFNPSATWDVLDIVITNDLASPVHPTSCSAMSLDHLPVLIDMTCPSFFHTTDCPDFRRIEWATFQVHLEDSILSYSELHNNRHVSLDIIWHYSSALAGTTLNSRPHDDPWSLIPACMHNKIHLKKQLRMQWKATRVPILKAEINALQRSVTHQRNGWRNDQWCMLLKSLEPEDQSLWVMTKLVMKVPTPSPPLVTSWRITLLDSKKAEALDESLESQFQPANDSFEPKLLRRLTWR